jgi:polyphosphate kinase
MGQVIGHFLGDLFPGTRIVGFCHFRVTRNSELYIDEEDIENLLKAVENELHNRRKGDAVRLEIEHTCPPEIRRALLGTLRLEQEDLYLIDGPLNPTRLMAIYHGDHSPELRDPPFIPAVASVLKGQRDIFAAIAERDILLHHPYESFNTVVDFLEQAAQDPKVLAIKQTLYRTGGDLHQISAFVLFEEIKDFRNRGVRQRRQNIGFALEHANRRGAGVGIGRGDKHFFDRDEPFGIWEVQIAGAIDCALTTSTKDGINFIPCK